MTPFAIFSRSWLYPIRYWLPISWWRRDWIKKDFGLKEKDEP